MLLKILIYGAGAIGRGFLGPLFSRYDIELSFVDNNKELVKGLKSRKSYKAAITLDEGYEIIDVPFRECFLLGEEIDIESYDLVISAVGPNNCYSLASDFKRARAVISCENDINTAKNLSALSGNSNIYFGIPDVITSNTASVELLKIDDLTTVSEQGILVIEKGNYSLPDEIEQVDKDKLNMHWMCKLFIHNAPHAITAYLGYLKGVKYIHESMADVDVNEVVQGAISEITSGVIGVKYATKEFANMYKEKELKRFRNKILFDTISRVAREPIRKLAKDNRLVLGLRIALFNNEKPIYTALGTKAALYYDNPDDKEAVYLQTLRTSIGDIETLKRCSDIDPLDPLNRFILEQDISRFINRKN